MTQVPHPRQLITTAHLTNTVNRELTNSQFDTRTHEAALPMRLFMHSDLRVKSRPTTRKPG